LLSCFLLHTHKARVRPAFTHLFSFHRFSFFTCARAHVFYAFTTTQGRFLFPFFQTLRPPFPQLFLTNHPPSFTTLTEPTPHFYRIYLNHPPAHTHQIVHLPCVKNSQGWPKTFAAHSAHSTKQRVTHLFCAHTHQKLNTDCTAPPTFTYVVYTVYELACFLQDVAEKECAVDDHTRSQSAPPDR
jgi:hypothetical protein